MLTRLCSNLGDGFVHNVNAIQQKNNPLVADLLRVLAIYFSKQGSADFWSADDMVIAQL